MAYVFFIDLTVLLYLMIVFMFTLLQKKDSGSCYVNNINTVFKLGIPPLVVVFLIAYFGVYLS